MNLIMLALALLIFFLIQGIPAVKHRKFNIMIFLFPLFFILALFIKPAGFLPGGILILIIASDKLVEGGSDLAERAGVPPLFIGIFIIGLGTSTPELFVNVISAIRGDTGLAMGNILGSNISNMGIVIGVAGLIAGTMKANSTIIRKEIPIMLAASVLLLLLVLDFPPFSPQGAGNTGKMILSMKDGLILLLGLALYLLYTINNMNKPEALVPAETPILADIPTTISKVVKRSSDDHSSKADASAREGSAAGSIIKILIGIGGLYIGGEFIISSSLSIAESLGAGTMTLGIIIGLGTSLPELATGINCALKKETDLVIGNVVGSNIFNVLLILGITAIIRPVCLSTEILIHFGIMIGISLLFFVSLGSNRGLNRKEALILLLSGIGYLGFSIITG
ncbi:MAG: calcium/sodium antiporter [Spirochaetales bacterium]|nr:calcium/sodium antiporter [Spirochaetales bacterium]